MKGCINWGGVVEALKGKRNTMECQNRHHTLRRLSGKVEKLEADMNEKKEENININENGKEKEEGSINNNINENINENVMIEDRIDYREIDEIEEHVHVSTNGNSTEASVKVVEEVEKEVENNVSLEIVSDYVNVLAENIHAPTPLPLSLPLHPLRLDFQRSIEEVDFEVEKEVVAGDNVVDRNNFIHSTV